MAATLASLWERKKKVQLTHASPTVDLTAAEEHTAEHDRGCKAFASATEAQSAKFISQAGNTPTDEDKQPQPATGQDKKRKRPHLSAEQGQILEELHSSCTDPSANQVNAAAKLTGLSEQLVKDLLEDKRKAKVQKATTWPKAAKPTDSTQDRAEAAQEDMEESVTVKAADISSGDSAVAPAGHNSIVADQLQLADQDRGPDHASQQASKPAAQAAAAADQVRKDTDDTQTHEQPEQDHSSSTKQQMLQQYQAELQSCMLQTRSIHPMASLPQFADGHLSRPEVHLAHSTSAYCIPPVTPYFSPMLLFQSSLHLAYVSCCLLAQILLLLLKKLMCLALPFVDLPVHKCAGASCTCCANVVNEIQ